MASKRGSRRQAEQDATEDVGSQLLLSFGLLESLLPIGGSEVQDAALGPARQKDERIRSV